MQEQQVGHNMGTDESNGGANKLGAVLMEDSRMVLEEHVQQTRVGHHQL